ncbi:unnamed protein product [Penicillium salamii]|uniref:CID domain-containing protein n=1 Tax=Penicillium salamii TaxID=1612424 RepID=A0A9W4NLN6_9EURO|nr:unnamed protein product [Penicillium salamii]CAG8376039.1 unnamed protein product [Penicillium salamii]CAG8384603.1 unnamed protein product [Penicillium salamii]CAG8416573.1 unnamed protein product [Penicillium salamii]
MGHQVAIAKASFTAALLRPDPSSVPRDEITAGHSSLESALSHCSHANIQECKKWLLEYVAFSANRVGGLAKYLVALAASEPSQPNGTNPSPKRRRLHILYLLNDLLHHSKYHLGTSTTFSTVSGSLQLHIVGLVGHAAACDRQKNPRHHRRLDDLLSIWSEHGYFNSEFVDKLREVVVNSASTGAAPLSDDVPSANAKKPGKNAPFVVPSAHGDPSAPYYDNPTGNFVPHILPKLTLSLQPGSVKPIQLLGGPADGKLVHVLQDFFGQVKQISSMPEPKDPDVDVGGLGHSIIRDEISKDILDGETYYGWTRAFCQQMKIPERSRSPSRSRSRSPANFKRRHSESYSPDSRSPHRSRSRARDVRRRYDSRSRSRSPVRSRESSYTPREPQSSHFPPPHQHQAPQYPPAPKQFPPPHNPNGQGHYGRPMPQSGYAPPPQNYGSWPPPPPQMPGAPFSQPGPGVHQSAFPPQFQHPPMPLPQVQGHPMPPGQYHFPPPYSGGQNSGWGPPTGPGGRPWR